MAWIKYLESHKTIGLIWQLYRARDLLPQFNFLFFCRKTKVRTVERSAKNKITDLKANRGLQGNWSSCGSIPRSSPIFIMMQSIQTDGHSKFQPREIGSQAPVKRMILVLREWEEGRREIERQWCLSYWLPSNLVLVFIVIPGTVIFSFYSS